MNNGVETGALFSPPVVSRFAQNAAFASLRLAHKAPVMQARCVRKSIKGFLALPSHSAFVPALNSGGDYKGYIIYKHMWYCALLLKSQTYIQTHTL